MWKYLFKPRVWVAKLLIAVYILFFLSFGFLDIFNPVRDFLSSEALSFKIGATSISVYLMLKAILTIVVLFWVAHVFSSFFEGRVKKIKNVRSNSKALMVKAVQIVTYFVAIVTGLNVLGIDLTALAVFSGAIGIGLGFGLQKITSNFISGLILLFEKSVEVDDLVELSDGIAGFVKKTNARYTLIETLDSKEIMIPNEDFITSRVVNLTYSHKRGRVDVSLGVSYGSNLEQVKEIMLEAARSHPRCSTDIEPVCYLREFADSSVNFLLFFWVDDVTQGRYGPKSDVMFIIWNKFKEHNIEIPFPQQDVHIKNWKGE